MLDLKAAVGAAAGVITFFGFVPYIISLLRGATIPNRATWLIWSVVGAVLFVSYALVGDRRSMWAPLSYVIGPVVIFFLSIRRGEGGFDRFDLGCLFAALVGLALWGLSGSPVYALFTNIGVDFAGALPTLRKAYKKPGTESRVAWSLFLAGNTLNLFAVASWRSLSVALPLYFFVVTLAVTLVAFRRPPPAVASL